VTFRHRLNLSFFAICLLTVGAFGTPTEATPDEHPVGAHEGSAGELAPAGATTDYPLTVVFSGLIAWHQDRDKLWALIPDSCYCPADVRQGFDELRLPPGVLDEAMTETDLNERISWLLDNFPPHCPTLLVEGATTDSGLDLTKPIPLSKGILGLQFQSSYKYLNTSLGILSSSEQVIATLNLTADATAARWAKTLHSDIKTSLQNGTAKSPLSLAVSLPTGFFLASATTPLRSFSYTTPGSKACSLGQYRSPTLLAEESRLESRADGGTTGILLNGKSVAGDLKPIDIAKGITIRISNQPADLNHDHLEAYRWFYNLTDSRLAKKYQHFPCEIEFQLGGNKCPQALLW
jgi:hypothetical protein